jgi:hypothetical protein
MAKMAGIEWQQEPVWEWRQLATAGGTLAERRAREAAAARQQGVIGGAVGLLVAAAFAFLLHRPVAATVIAAISLSIALLALAAPLTLYRRLRDGLDRFGHWVSTGVTWVLMTVLFYLLFLPVGLVMRAAGKLTFTRFADPGLATYWTTIEGHTPSTDTYRKQF